MLPTLKQDKANHYIYGVILFILGCIICPAVGMLLCAAFAIGKEIYDLVTKKGIAEAYDALFTILGGVSGLIIYLIAVIQLK